MAYDWNDDIADRAADEMVTAITAARDGGDYAAELTALSESMTTIRKAALPVSDLVDTLEDGVHVSLLPSLDGVEGKETRGYARHEYAVGIAVECQCGKTDVTRQATLMDLSQRIANGFKRTRMTGDVPGVWERTQISQRIDRDRLRELSVFLSFRQVLWIGRAL